jgi:hypothetical protein
MKVQESIHDYLLRRLAELRGQHARIAAETGVPQSTLSRIQSGQGSPRLESVQPLLDWIAAYDAQRAARKRASRGARRSGAGGARVVVPSPSH